MASRGPERGYPVLSNQLIFWPILSNQLDFFVSIINNQLKLSQWSVKILDDYQ